MWTCLKSSIGKKDVVALTGLGLCGFLIAHLAGNLLLFVGPEIFNTYSHKLISSPFIYVAEAILLSLFLVHFGLSIWLQVENRKARPVSYVMKNKTGRGATAASSTMAITGVITLVFLVLHLKNLKFGEEYHVAYNGILMRDLYRLVIDYFSSLGNVVWYVIAHAALAFHTGHGFQSAFQSLGFRHPRYTPWIEITSKVYAVGISLGFASLAIWCHFQGIT